MDQGLVSKWEAGTIGVTRANARRIRSARALSKAKAAEMLTRGQVVGPIGASKHQPLAQPLRATRRLPLDPETELAALRQQAADLRAEIEAREALSSETVRRHRAQLGLSAREYGAMLGVSTQTVYGWENGRFGPGRVALRRWFELVRSH